MKNLEIVCYVILGLSIYTYIIMARVPRIQAGIDECGALGAIFTNNECFCHGYDVDIDDFIMVYSGFDCRNCTRLCRSMNLSEDIHNIPYVRRIE